MKNNDVQFTEDAYTDIDEILSYLAETSMTAALAFKEKIVGLIDDLELFPRRGRAMTDEQLSIYNFRMHSIGKYVAFYSIADKTIYVHRVLHGSRNYIPIMIKYIEKLEDPD